MYEIKITLPKWIESFLKNQPNFSNDIEEQIRFVLALTEKNILEKTGGPFGAAVFEIESGRLISVGVNVVVNQNCSAAHAEMMALMMAQKKLKHYNLGANHLPGHRLVTSGRMCAMCLGNVCWSGIKEVISSAEPEDVEAITGFDEGPTPHDYIEQLETRGIKIITEILRSEGQGVLKLYVNLGGQIYNANIKK
tara:strand:- start:1894 stop:2475 length:582 start_codon:yes stop_codon:yes gene_type:complete